MQKLGGKQKRRARGSLEEELSTPKRANMAECQEEEAAEFVKATNEEAVNVEGEPSNGELRENYDRHSNQYCNYPARKQSNQK